MQPQSLLLLWVSLLITLSAFVSAHMIEVSAGKKECFFEDLHINDKVRISAMSVRLRSSCNLDDCDIPSRWRRAS